MSSAQTVAGLAAAFLLATGAAQADVSISNKPTSDMSCDAGVCTATAQKAVLNVGELQTMLASSDVTVNTGSLAKDISIDQPLSWTSTSRLTLDAQQSVIVKKQVTVAGAGAMTITTNDGSKHGEFVVVPDRGSVQFWDLSSSLIIDGINYILVGDIETLASDIAANSSGFYALARSYDASVDGIYSSSPIQTVFTGKLQGFGNAIDNLTISFPRSAQAIGLFGSIQRAGEIDHLIISNLLIEGSPLTAVGPFAAGNVGKIMRSWSSGTISIRDGETNAGGLVGANFGKIVDCRSAIQLKVASVNDSNIGPLAGRNGGTILRSYAMERVVIRGSGSTYVGGLVGVNDGQIQDSFSVGAVTGGKGNAGAIGGLVGKNEPNGEILSTYAAGKIVSKGGMQHISGGLIGDDEAASGNLSATYWNLDKGISDPSKGAGNIDNDPGITGLTDAELKSGLPQGFDPAIWGQSPHINHGYPYLLANPPQ